MKKRILFLLAMVALAATASLSMAQNPQKTTNSDHKVDFTINYHVESNYNTAELRQQLFDKNDSNIMIISHRGDWHGTAENSLHSIQKAIEKGCEAVMVDVRKTKDDSLIIFSDDTLSRMTNGTGAVKDFTLAEIKGLCMKEYKGNLTPLKVPTLAEALRFCKGKILIGVTNYKPEFGISEPTP
jgi:glycerophosphoryl diester phosphodiesterase